MKKILALLLIAILAFSVAACGGGGSQEAKIAEDNSVMAMSFTPPESFVTVIRGVETLKADGSIGEKDIGYTFEGDATLVYAYAPDQSLAEEFENLDEMETVEAGGVTFYLQTYTSSTYAYTQYGKDVYGVAYRKGDSKEPLEFEKILKGVSFTDATETTVNENPEDFGDLVYTIDSTLFNKSVNSSVTENADGSIKSKTCVWGLGTEEGKINYRVSISVFRNTTVEKESADYKDNDSYEMGEKTINGIAYTTVKNTSETAPLGYYTQHGEDVYIISNVGISNGLWTTRSEESFTVLDNLLNSISFK